MCVFEIFLEIGLPSQSTIAYAILLVTEIYFHSDCFAMTNRNVGESISPKLFQQIFCQIWNIANLFPGGKMAKKLPANAGEARDAGDTRDAGLIPGWRRSLGEGNGNLL